MRSLFLLFFFFCSVFTYAQQAEHLIIITTDGFRWQELFTGMDTALANNKTYNEDDSSKLFTKYYSVILKDRRQKLMPFLWSVINEQGQIYGNRAFDNKVNNANPFWFSYPGYSEIFTGFVDTAINSNEHPPNSNTTILDFLQQQPNLKNKVAAFGAWEAFNNILNDKRATFPVIAGFEKSGKINPSTNQFRFKCGF